MTYLSPAAQAVLSAYNAGFDRPVAVHHKPRIAAALRAAADQVVPFAKIAPQGDLESRREAMIWGMQHQTQLTRQHLLAIAAELETSTTENR